MISSSHRIGLWFAEGNLSLLFLIDVAITENVAKPIGSQRNFRITETTVGNLLIFPSLLLQLILFLL